MKKFSTAAADDYRILLDALREIPDQPSVEEAAQQVTDAVYEAFSDSLVLLRFFNTISYADLKGSTRDFVDMRLQQTGNSHLVRAGMPVFTLMGTRGRENDWNLREQSQRFRCIPLASTAFVSSLSMLSLHLRAMRFPLEYIDSWEESVVSRGRADGYSGLLYIRDAAVDRDAEERPAVPVQEFVHRYGVVTAIGCGGGYAAHPSLVTLFAFTNEPLQPQHVQPLMQVLKEYTRISEQAVCRGDYFRDEGERSHQL